MRLWWGKGLEGRGGGWCDFASSSVLALAQNLNGGQGELQMFGCLLGLRAEGQEAGRGGGGKELSLI